MGTEDAERVRIAGDEQRTHARMERIDSLSLRGIWFFVWHRSILSKTSERNQWVSEGELRIETG